MGEYKLKIGTSEFQTEIGGTEDWHEVISRDFTDKTLRVKGDFKFTGYQGLLNIIHNSLLSNGVCQSLTGKIYHSDGQNFTHIWTGDIKPQDGEFDLLRYNVETQVLDNSWAAKFNNAKDQEVKMDNDRTKNNLAMSPCPKQFTHFFNPTDGSYYLGNTYCYKVSAIFEFLCNYLSDNTVTFQSDFFTTGAGKQYYITTGYEIANRDNTLNPEISFSTLFSEMDKKFNLWIIIEGTIDAPILRIERAGYSLVESPVITVSNPGNIIMKTDLEQLYTKITVGSNAPDFDEIDGADYRVIPLYGWNEENYNTSGDCDFENNELDLSSTWRIDTNSIWHQITASDPQYNDDIFIVEVGEAVDNYNLIQYTTDITITSGSGIYYVYNKNLQNFYVLNNWFGGIPSAILANYGNPISCYVDTLFDTNVNTYRHPLSWTNDSTDPAYDYVDMYDPVTIDITAVVGGIYRVKIVYSFSQSTPKPGLRLYFTSEDGSGTPISTVHTHIIPASPPTPYTASIEFEYEIYLDAGDTLAHSVRHGYSSGAQETVPDYTITDAYMTVEHTTYDDQVIVEAPDNPLIYIYDINDFKLTTSEFEALKASKTGQVRFLDDNTGRAWDVWPKEMAWNRERQIVKSGEFIGRANINQLCWLLDGSFGTGSWDDSCYWLDAHPWVVVPCGIVLNYAFSGNPLADWTLTACTQTGNNTFGSISGGAWVFQQVIDLPAGTYRFDYSAILQPVSSMALYWDGQMTMTGISGTAQLFTTSTDWIQNGSVIFTVSGSSTRTLTITYTASIPGLIMENYLAEICE